MAEDGHQKLAEMEKNLSAEQKAILQQQAVDAAIAKSLADKETEKRIKSKKTQN